MDNIPYELGKQVLKVGKVEWGALEPKTDDELVEWFKETLPRPASISASLRKRRPFTDSSWRELESSFASAA